MGKQRSWKNVCNRESDKNQWRHYSTVRSSSALLQTFRPIYTNDCLGSTFAYPSERAISSGKQGKTSFLFTLWCQRVTLQDTACPSWLKKRGRTKTVCEFSDVQGHNREEHACRLKAKWGGSDVTGSNQGEQCKRNTTKPDEQVMNKHLNHF